MRARRLARLAAAIVAAFPAFASADAALGPSPGNVLHPAAPNPSTAGRWTDPEGLGTRMPAARTPTGLLYDMPLEADREEDVFARGGWRLWAFIEAGGLQVHGGERAAGSRPSQDFRDGPYVSVFALAAERPASAHYIEAVGGALGMRDQYYRVQGGRYNDWRVSAFVDSIPHAVTASFRSLWSGVGSNTLLLQGLAPGGAASAAATRAQIEARLADTGETRLDLLRRKAGVRFEKKLGERWNASASFTSERKQGARPLGAAFGGGDGGGSLDIAEPVDHQTHELLAALRYADAGSSFNLSASASIFRNDIDTLTFQNPLFVSPNGTSGLRPSAFATGRFDLAPDNQHYRAKVEYARALPQLFRGHFSASASLGTMRQDDALPAPTESTLAGGTVGAGGASLANAWNTPDALGRRSADLAVDTRRADLRLGFAPWRALDLQAKLRYDQTDGSSQYLSCNPLTGQLGRILNDGSGLSIAAAATLPGANPPGTPADAFDAARCELAAARARGLVPAAGNVPIARVPKDHRRVHGSLDARYRLRGTTTLNATLEREEMRREHRERERTWEDRLRLAVVERGWGDGTLRAAYEHARRAGTQYRANPYEPFLSASLGPAPSSGGIEAAGWFRSLGQFRSFDLADRTQDSLDARWNHAFHATLDGAVALHHREARYPDAYGRSGRQSARSATFDLSWQAGSGAQVHAFYAHQRASGHQAGIQPGTCRLDSTYYFYSDGTVVSAPRGGDAPPPPENATLVARRDVLASNWQETCGAAAPTSPLFPDSRGWTASSRDRNDVVGLGAKLDLGRARLDATFTRSLGRTRIGYTYAAAALGMSALQASLAGSGFSDMRLAASVASVSVTFPMGRNLAVRLLARHESGRIRDWHYDGIADNPMPTSTTLFLDSGPRDHRDTVLGALLQVRL